jgi:hypothetical protein
MNLLFVGESWKGSSARSLREGLEDLPGVSVGEVGEDHFFPKYRTFVLRACTRLVKRLQVSEFEREIGRRLQEERPEVLLVYKGAAVSKQLVRRAKSIGVFTVNVFPDNSPHAQGAVLMDAVGEYDLVVSTKPFHPDGWYSVYGYTNRCVFVPHGYDPATHYWSGLPSGQDIDVILVATWRPEYHRLMLALVDALGELPLHVQISGAGWLDRKNEFPSHWVFGGPVRGREYGKLLRRAKIAIAPVSTEAVIDGVSQPGDEDTTRTYELAAAHCFFLHRRTNYATTIFDEKTEVPMWDTPQELANKIMEFLPREAMRMTMAARAHSRAVPEYSTPARAKQVLDHIVREMEQRGDSDDGSR